MREKVDTLTNIFSQQEILKRIAWLENEIDTYFLLDLPTQHLESELKNLYTLGKQLNLKQIPLIIYITYFKV